jgi:hypothetical protein
MIGPQEIVEARRALGEQAAAVEQRAIRNRACAISPSASA